MGHLVNPISFRLGVSRYWNSRWIASSRHKYHFLFKSDWNIFEVVKRFFKLNRFTKESYIFSHCLVVRTNDVSNFFIFFWDGKTLQSFGNFFFEVVRFLFKTRLLRKMSMVLSFFFYRQNFVNFMSLFLKFFYFLFRFKKNLFYFFKQKIFYSLLNIFFYSPVFFFYSGVFFLKHFFFKFFYFFYNFFLLLKKKWFLGIIKSISYYFRIFFFKILFFFKFFSFFKFFFNDMTFLRVFTYQNPFSQSIFFKNTGRSRVFTILHFFLKQFVSGLGLNYNFNLFLHPITKLDYSSAFIGRYLAIRLKQRYRLMQALGPIFKELKKNTMIEGYRIRCSGRFTKKEIATYQWHRYGSVPFSTLKAPVDFVSIPFVMKYSVCSFRVWLQKKSLKISTGLLNHYFFRELGKFSYKKSFKLTFFSKNNFFSRSSLYSNTFLNLKRRNMGFDVRGLFGNSDFEKIYESGLLSLYKNNNYFYNNFYLSSKIFPRTYSSSYFFFKGYSIFLNRFFLKNFLVKKKSEKVLKLVNLLSFHNLNNFNNVNYSFRFFSLLEKLLNMKISYKYKKMFGNFFFGLLNKKPKSNLIFFLVSLNLYNSRMFFNYKKRFDFSKVITLFYINFFSSFLKVKSKKLNLLRKKKLKLI